jgi:hypothetical protein
MKPQSISAKFPSTKLSFHPVGQISHTTVLLNIWNSICTFQGWCPFKIADLLFNSMDCFSLCAILYYLKADPVGKSFCPFGRKLSISLNSKVHCKRKRCCRTYMHVTLQRLLFISHVSSCVVKGSNCTGQLSRHTAAILPFCWRQFCLLLIIHPACHGGKKFFVCHENYICTASAVWKWCHVRRRNFLTTSFWFQCWNF